MSFMLFPTARNAHYQTIQGQKDGVQMPDNYKEMVAETDNDAYFPEP